MFGISELNVLCEKRAEAIQDKLPSFQPLPPDPVNDRFFKTLRLHSIWDPEHFDIPEEKADLVPDEPPMDAFPLFSLSIGYDSKEIASAIDSLSFFDSETIPIEIASFAHTYLKISSFYSHTDYFDGSITKKIEDDAFGEFNAQCREVIKAFPILTELTCLTSLLQSIFRASDAKILSTVEEKRGLMNREAPWSESFSHKQQLYYDYCAGFPTYDMVGTFEKFGLYESRSVKLQELACLESFLALKLRSPLGILIDEVVMARDMLESKMDPEDVLEFWFQKLSSRKRKMTFNDQSQSKKQKVA